MDQKAHDLISKLEEFVDDEGMKYNTMVELA
jgi:hypothetical protein